MQSRKYEITNSLNPKDFQFTIMSNKSRNRNKQKLEMFVISP